MSSSDRLNPQQLRLFIPAKELHTAEKVAPWEIEEMMRRGTPSSEQMDPNDRWVDETPDELWDRKLAESKRSAPFDISRHEQISKHGILRPVVLTGGQIRDGYHRVAIANDLNPDTEVPVEYKERSEPHDFKG